MRHHFTSIRMAIINKNTNNKHWQECGGKGSYTVDRNVNWYSQSGKQYGGSQKIKTRTSIFTPGIQLKENNNNKKTTHSKRNMDLNRPSSVLYIYEDMEAI